MAEQDWLTPATAPAPSLYQNLIAAPSPGIPAYDLRPLSLGELLDRTFSIYRSRFWLFCGISTMAAAVELAAGGVGRVVVHHYTKDPATIYSADIGITYLASIIYFFVYCVTQAATCFAMGEVYLGRPASIGPSYRAVGNKWYAWIGIGLWQGWSAAWIFMAIFIPFIILVAMKIAFGPSSSILVGLLMVALGSGALIYGVIAYIRNSLAIPAKVMEGVSVRNAMRRSKKLAEGTKGRIFVLGLIVWALHTVAGLLEIPFAVITLYARSASHIFAEMTVLLIIFVAHTVVPPIASIGLCLFYFDQRVRREAFDLEVLLGPEQASVVAPFAEGRPEAETALTGNAETQANALL